MKSFAIVCTVLSLSMAPAVGQTIGAPQAQQNGREQPITMGRQVSLGSSTAKPTGQTSKSTVPSGELRGILAPIREVSSANRGTGVLGAITPATVATSGLKVNCRVPLTSVGSINVGEATAVITNTSIDIISGSRSVYPNPLLSGLVLRTESGDSASPATRKLTGLALFMAGTLIGEMSESSPDDIIFRTEGSSLEGQIIGNDPTSLLIRQKDGTIARVNAEVITFVRSPRAFLFNILGTSESGAGGSMRTDARSITFQSTGTTNGVSLSSVVKSKDELNEEETLGLGKFGPSLQEEDDMPPLIKPAKRAFPFWP